MFDRKQKIMEKVMSLPKGEYSPSGRYWCVTCKKLFNLDKPVCPYMSQMCINTPIAIENMPPESSEWMEKMGLFYPKIPQKLFASIVKPTPGLGKSLAVEYIRFMNDWKINYAPGPLQTIKSFIVLFTGCETAQRVNADDVTFVVTDLTKIWSQEILFPILAEACEELKHVLKISKNIKFDSIEIIGERPIGKYYCGMCKKFFEFGIPRDKVTCPLMSQKCMFDPTAIEKMQYSIEDLLKVYTITPDIFKRFMSLVSKDSDKSRGVLNDILTNEWKFQITAEQLVTISSLLGI